MRYFFPILSIYVIARFPVVHVSSKKKDAERIDDDRTTRLSCPEYARWTCQRFAQTARSKKQSIASLLFPGGRMRLSLDHFEQERHGIAHSPRATHPETPLTGCQAASIDQTYTSNQSLPRVPGHHPRLSHSQASDPLP